jgi:hypothetical protein
VPTTETSIWLALKARVQSLPAPVNFPAQTGRVDWPGVPFTKPHANGQAAPYLECRLLPNTAQRVFIGSSDPHRRMGILQLTYMHPIVLANATNVDWQAQFSQIGGAIAEHFPADLRMTFEDVTVRVEKAPDVSQAFVDEAWWRVPVSIRYRND